MNWRIGVVMALAFTLGSCAYTVERKWTYTFNPSPQPRTFEQQKAEADEAEMRFQDTLRDCISKFDAGRLSAYDETHDYRISGWFIDSDRTGPVIHCMREKGWIAMPTTLLAP